MRILAVDGNSVFRRNWEAPDGKNQSVALNRTVAAVAREAERFDRVVVAWDSEEEGFRRARGAWYKASRTDPGPGFQDERRRAMARLAEDGCANIVAPVVDVDGFVGAAEADDVLAWVAFEFSAVAQADWHLRIVSSDGDLESLVRDSPRIDILKPGKKREDALWTPKTVRNSRGVEPSKIAELKALMGDKDEVPGFVGIGPKCGAMLIRSFETAAMAAERAPDDLSIEPAFLNAAQRKSLRDGGANRANAGVWFATLRPSLPLDFATILNAERRTESYPVDDIPISEPKTEPKVVPASERLRRIEILLEAILRKLSATDGSQC